MGDIEKLRAGIALLPELKNQVKSTINPRFSLRMEHETAVTIIAALEAAATLQPVEGWKMVPVETLKKHCYCDELVDQEWDANGRSSHGTIGKCDWCKVLEAPSPVIPSAGGEVAKNVLKDVSTEWETTREPGSVTVHSRMIDGVLCRWWGERTPGGVAIIDAALQEQKP